MSASQASVIPVRLGRPVSLLQAFVVSLAFHAVLLTVLIFFGVLSMLFHRPVPGQPDREPSVRFSFAPETERAEEAAAENPSRLVAPPAEAPVQEEPDPDAPATLDRPQPRVLPVPPSADAPETAGEADESASDGRAEPVPAVEPFEPVETREPEVEAGPPDAETALLEERRAERIEEGLDLPVLDGGDVTPDAPAAEFPSRLPPPGRPDGVSLEERISDFGRAVQRLRAAPSPRPERPPANVFEPDWSNLPHTGQALGNLTFESGDFDWEDYGRQIYWIIWRTWHSRLLARVDDFEKWAQQNGVGMLDHVNAVRFTIESNGEISSILLEAESGMLPFDLSATEALDEAVLPPLPAGFPRDTETVHAQFIGFGPIGNMRRGLQEYKRRGWF